MGEKFKFDVIIGNPPYQEEVAGNGRSNPIYNTFMEQTYKIGKKIELITPARFLFNAGQTPKQWNQDMLNSKHLEVLYYNANSAEVFANTDIKGGVAVTYYDNEKEVTPIGIFVPHQELNGIVRKVVGYKGKNLSEIICGAVPYRFSDVIKVERPDLTSVIGKSFDLRSNIIDKLKNEIFFERKPVDDKIYVQIYGLENKKRVYRWIRQDYLDTPDNFNQYKVFIPESNGSGAIGDILSSPLVAAPLIGHTQTFISVGGFKTAFEAEALLKYIKSKFARVLLSVMKVTQHNPVSVWGKVPMQDFTPLSDINWRQSVADIDRQLYVKYELMKSEIEFIEKNAREMD